METLVNSSNSATSELTTKLPWSMSSMWSPNPEQQWWTFWRLYYPELVWPTFYNSDAVSSHWNIPSCSPVVSTIGANTTTARSNLKFGIDVILSDLNDAKRTVQDRYYTHGQDHELTTDLTGKSQTPSSLASTTTSSTPSRRKRSWSRAVFSNLQRKGLEKRFQLQKYITKPDRRQLAATLGLTDAQVKVWFQNRRMKWRHNRDKSHQVPTSSTPTPSPAQP